MQSQTKPSVSSRILGAGVAASILRNLGVEDKAFAREMGVTGDEDMNVYVDSPVTIKQSSPTEPATSRLGTVAKLAIGAGLLGTGAGAGLGIPMLLGGGKEVMERVQEIDNTREVVPGFGVPD